MMLPNERKLITNHSAVLSSKAINEYRNRKLPIVIEQALCQKELNIWVDIAKRKWPLRHQVALYESAGWNVHFNLTSSEWKKNSASAVM